MMFHHQSGKPSVLTVATSSDGTQHRLAKMKEESVMDWAVYVKNFIEEAHIEFHKQRQA